MIKTPVPVVDFKEKLLSGLVQDLQIEAMFFAFVDSGFSNKAEVAQVNKKTIMPSHAWSFLLPLVRLQAVNLGMVSPNLLRF